MNAPAITIAIPTRNRATELDRCITSVLSQSISDWEIVISDNASADDTPAVVERYTADPRVRFFRQEVNLGMVGNWNFCLNQAHGKFFVLLSDDDWIEARFLEEISRLCDLQPDVVLAYTSTTIHFPDRRKSSVSDDLIESGAHFVDGWLVGKRNPWLCSIAFRTETMRANGGFKRRPRLMADAEMISKVVVHGSVASSSALLSNYSFAATNISSSTSLMKWFRDDVDLFIRCRENWNVDGFQGNIKKAMRRMFGLATRRCFHLGSPSFGKGLRQSISIIPQIARIYGPRFAFHVLRRYPFHYLAGRRRA